MHPIKENILERVSNYLSVRENILHNITYWTTLVCIVWSIIVTIILIRMDQDVTKRDQLIAQQEATINNWTNQCKTAIASK